MTKEQKDQLKKRCEEERIIKAQRVAFQARRETRRTEMGFESYPYEKDRKLKVQQVLDRWKECGCQICGEKTFCCLIAHHVKNGRVTPKISQLWGSAPSEVVKFELETNCICLCLNCHRKLHSGLFNVIVNLDPPIKVERIVTGSENSVPEST